jgi:hypothetical protein
MAKVPCNLTIADILEYNIDLDADAYPLIAFFSLAMSGRDEHYDFFQFIRAPVRSKRAYKRAVAIANLAGTWNSDLDFEVFDVRWDGAV